MSDSARGRDKNVIRSIPDYLFRLLVQDTGTFAIFLMDPRGRVITWNKGAENLLGYSEDEVLGTSFSRFFAEEAVQRQRPEQELREAAATGRTQDTNWLLRKDGSRLWASGTTIALLDNNGVVSAFGKIITDLTEQRRAEEERTELLSRERAAEEEARAADQLRKSEERFHLLVESVKDYAIFMLDKSGHIASWNEGAERITGYREEEVLGKHFEMFYTPEDRARGIPRGNLDIAAAEGRLETEGWRVRKDGSQFWADVVITALRDAGGRLVGFAKVVRDLTERRKADQVRLRLAEEQAARTAAQDAEKGINNILSSITDAFFAVDREFRLTYVNDRARQLLRGRTGHPRADLIGSALWAVAPSLRGTVVEREYRRVIAEHVPAQFEYCSPTDRRWYDVHAYPSDGGMSVYLRDVTERRHLEEERNRLIRDLAAERSWLRTVIEFSPVGIIRVEGVDGRRVVANRQCEELFGRQLPPEGGIDQYVGQIFLPDGTPRPRSDLVTVRAIHGQIVINEEELLRHPTGREVRVLASGVPIREGGRTAGAVVVYQDVTRIRELERLREEWTSVVTHDLRQPIAVILGYVGLLERQIRPRLTERESQSLEHVLIAASNLNKMIGDLLEVSRIEARRLELQLQMVDLNELIRGVVSRAAAISPEHPIRLEMRGDIPASCVDPSRVEQILGNLLSNAAKYSYPRTEILVTAERRDGQIEATVTNRGPGIAPSEMGKLFSRFYRTATARVGATAGLGLGLYITKGLVEAHGGRIWLESVPEQTTTFHFTLPIVAPCPDQSAEGIVGTVDREPPASPSPRAGEG